MVWFESATFLFIVPELLFYELANALRYNPNFSPKDVNEALHSVFDMGLEVRKVDRKVMEQATTIAFKYNITFYDAYFLALSRKEEKPFITADYKFAEKMKGVNPVRNSSGALNPAGIILKSNSAAEQRGIISNGVKGILRLLEI